MPQDYEPRSDWTATAEEAVFEMKAFDKNTGDVLECVRLSTSPEVKHNLTTYRGGVTMKDIEDAMLEELKRRMRNKER